MTSEQQYRVGIIGTAGRDIHSDLLTEELFGRMVMKAKEVIRGNWGLNWKNVDLVSGGAGWSDHVAVELFRSGYGRSLTIYSAHKWDQHHEKFVGNPSAIISNELHQFFSEKMRRNTLSELNDALHHGAKINSSTNTFYERNSLVAKNIDYLLAFSWSKGVEPRWGGTCDTWKKCHCTKLHIPLHTV